VKLQQGIQALLDDGILQAEDLSAQRSVKGVIEGVVENADVDPLFPEDAEEFTNISTINEENGDSDCDIDNWVRPRVPGEVLRNWSSEEIIQVTLLQE
jgi:hypothetical protein